MSFVDFALLNFAAAFPAGASEATRAFFVGGTSRVDRSNGDLEGYFILNSEIHQPRDAPGFVVLINGRDVSLLSGGLTTPATLCMEPIPPGILKRGENRLTVQPIHPEQPGRVAVLVHWRERLE